MIAPSQEDELIQPQLAVTAGHQPGQPAAAGAHAEPLLGPGSALFLANRNDGSDPMQTASVASVTAAPQTASRDVNHPMHERLSCGRQPQQTHEKAADRPPLLSIGNASPLLVPEITPGCQADTAPGKGSLSGAANMPRSTHVPRSQLATDDIADTFPLTSGRRKRALTTSQGVAQPEGNGGDRSALRTTRRSRLSNASKAVPLPPSGHAPSSVQQSLEQHADSSSDPAAATAADAKLTADGAAAPASDLKLPSSHAELRLGPTYTAVAGTSHTADAAAAAAGICRRSSRNQGALWPGSQTPVMHMAQQSDHAASGGMTTSRRSVCKRANAPADQYLQVEHAGGRLESAGAPAIDVIDALPTADAPAAAATCQRSSRSRGALLPGQQTPVMHVAHQSNPADAFPARCNTTAVAAVVTGGVSTYRRSLRRGTSPMPPHQILEIPARIHPTAHAASAHAAHAKDFATGMESCLADDKPPSASAAAPMAPTAHTCRGSTRKQIATPSLHEDAMVVEHAETDVTMTVHTRRRSARKHTPAPSLQGSAVVAEHSEPAAKRAKRQGVTATAVHTDIGAEHHPICDVRPESATPSQDALPDAIGCGPQAPLTGSLHWGTEHHAAKQSTSGRRAHRSARPGKAAADSHMPTAAAAAAHGQAKIAHSDASLDEEDGGEAGTARAKPESSSRRSARMQLMGCLAVSSGQYLIQPSVPKAFLEAILYSTLLSLYLPVYYSRRMNLF